MPTSQNSLTTTRILVVVDWTVDADAVVAALRRRAGQENATFTLMVPGRLHGLDWVGDPTASVPCAQRQVDRLAELSGRAALDVEVVGVGDPDVISAIGDVLDGREVSEVLLIERRRRFAGHPLDLVHRAQRATGLPARRIDVRPSAGRRSGHGWALLPRGGHCEAEAPQAA